MDAIKQSSSWEVIRKASSQAQDSSWDKLRQGHERSNIPGRAGASQDVPRELSADEERALEQAKFDAMLEAERNVGK